MSPDDLTSLMSGLALGSESAIDDREERDHRLRRPASVGRHVMRVTINATNVTVINGPAPGTLPTVVHQPLGPHVRHAEHEARGRAARRALTPPGTPRNTPRVGDMLGVYLPDGPQHLSTTEGRSPVGAAQGSALDSSPVFVDANVDW